MSCSNEIFSVLHQDQEYVYAVRPRHCDVFSTGDAKVTVALKQWLPDGVYSLHLTVTENGFVLKKLDPSVMPHCVNPSPISSLSEVDPVFFRPTPLDFYSPVTFIFPWNVRVDEIPRCKRNNNMWKGEAVRVDIDRFAYEHFSDKTLTFSPFAKYCIVNNAVTCSSNRFGSLLQN